MKSDICANIITDLFEQLVQRNDSFKYGKEGIYFVLHVSGRCHGFEKDGNTYHDGWEGESYSFAHIVILRPSYVFIAITKSGDTPSIKEFENTSNHDSCWRTDGLESPITKLYFDTYREAYANMPEDEAPSPRASNVDFRFGHGPFSMGDVFKFVKAETKRSEGKYSGYDLVELEIIKKTVEI